MYVMLRSIWDIKCTVTRIVAAINDKLISYQWSDWYKVVFSRAINWPFWATSMRSIQSDLEPAVSTGSSNCWSAHVNPCFSCITLNPTRSLGSKLKQSIAVLQGFGLMPIGAHKAHITHGSCRLVRPGQVPESVLNYEGQLVLCWNKNHSHS